CIPLSPPSRFAGRLEEPRSERREGAARKRVHLDRMRSFLERDLPVLPIDVEQMAHPVERWGPAMATRMLHHVLSGARSAPAGGWRVGLEAVVGARSASRLTRRSVRSCGRTRRSNAGS